MTTVAPVFAIVTPLNSGGEVDYGALSDYTQFLQEHGVRSIITNGTTGEFPSLTIQERIRIVELCRRCFGGTIVNHISACCHRDCLALLDHSREHADGVLLLPPFYYAGIGQTGCLAFMRTVLERCTIPAYLYHFPEHTQVSLSAETVRTLSREFGCVAGVKDSGGDLRCSREFKNVSSGLQVFVGGDRCALDALTAGLDGSVTGGGNPVPELLVGLHSCFAARDLESARRAQETLDAWTTFRERAAVAEIPLTKAALGARISGFPFHVRPPFVAADETQIADVRSSVLAAVKGEASRMMHDRSPDSHGAR